MENDPCWPPPSPPNMEFSIIFFYFFFEPFPYRFTKENLSETSKPYTILLNFQKRLNDFSLLYCHIYVLLRDQPDFLPYLCGPFCVNVLDIYHNFKHRSQAQVDTIIATEYINFSVISHFVCRWVIFKWISYQFPYESSYIYLLFSAFAWTN